MLTITNRKVAGFDPRWASCRGFSLLFDNPGDCLVRTGDRLDLRANLADPALGFYRLLHESVARPDRDHLLNAYLFCPLPPASYHVTVWDGVHDSNLDQVPEAHRADFRSLLVGLPDSLCRPLPLLDSLVHSSLATLNREIRFRFERLGNWSNTSVVAELVPADEESSAAMQRLVALRAAWNESFQARFGISPSNPHHFAPHVTLGYFANRDWAGQMSAPQEEWNRTLVERMRGRLLPLAGISLYGFTDMATFFKRAAPH
jgi:hypothetical protein